MYYWKNDLQGLLSEQPAAQMPEMRQPEMQQPMMDMRQGEGIGIGDVLKGIAYGFVPNTMTAIEQFGQMRGARKAASGKQGAAQYEQLAQYWADKDPEKAAQYLEMAQSMQPKAKEAFAKEVGINPATGEAEMVIVYRDGSREFTGIKADQRARSVGSASSAPGRLPTGYMWNEEAGQAMPIPGVPQKPVGALRSSVRGAKASAKSSPVAQTRQAQDDGMIPMPIGKVTQEQRSTLGYADRMLQAEKALEGIQGGAPTEKTELAGSIPLVGGYMRRLMQSDSQQQFSNLANEWIRAKLRKESGAAIGVDEMQKEFETYFPQPGDSDAVIEQKATLRRNALQSMARQAGSSVPAWNNKIKRYNPATGKIE